MAATPPRTAAGPPPPGTHQADFRAFVEEHSRYPRRSALLYQVYLELAHVQVPPPAQHTHTHSAALSPLGSRSSLTGPHLRGGSGGETSRSGTARACR